LKYLKRIRKVKYKILLIAPEGIEISYYYNFKGLTNKLLIAPEGIEISARIPDKQGCLQLLIAPEGIEMGDTYIGEAVNKTF